MGIREFLFGEISREIAIVIIVEAELSKTFQCIRALPGCEGYPLRPSSRWIGSSKHREKAATGQLVRSVVVRGRRLKDDHVCAEKLKVVKQKHMPDDVYSLDWLARKLRNDGSGIAQLPRCQMLQSSCIVIIALALASSSFVSVSSG